MTLLEIVQRISDFRKDIEDGVYTIYAPRPWQPSSPAIVIPQPEDGRLPDEAKHLGYQYFLEVFIATDMLQAWDASLGPEPSLEERCRRLISYAENDA